MKKTLLYSLTAALLLIVANVQAQNKLAVGDISCMKSMSVDMPISLSNQNPSVVAMQFQITVPEYVSINTDQSSVKMDQTRASNHQVRVANLGNHTYNVMVMSPTNTPFRANKGKVFTLDTRVASDATLVEGQGYPITLSNVVISDSLGNNVMTGFDNGSITLEPCPDFIVSNITVTSGDATPEGDITFAWKVNNIGTRNSMGGWREVISFVSDITGDVFYLDTQHYTNSLAAGQSVSRTATIAVPRIPGFHGGYHVQIRLVPNSDSGESLEYQANNTSVSEASYKMNKKLYLSLDGNSQGYLYEANGPYDHYCFVERSGLTINDEVFELTKTEGDSRVSMPASVTIPRGSSSQYFELQVRNNDVINVDTMTVTCRIDVQHDYPAIASSAKLIDDDLPTLTVSTSNTLLKEGDEFTLTITSSHVRYKDVKIQLSSERASRFQMPSSVVLPAGQTSVTVNAKVIDDDVVNLQNELTNIVCSAPRYNSGSVALRLSDNDLPTLSMTVSKTTVYEHEGRRAILCTITRTNRLDSKVNIRLIDDGNNDLYYPSETITMTKGQEKAEFYIGVVDDDITQGRRDVTFTASVYVSSCGCSIGAAAGGEFSKTITIYDNDTPHFTLTTEDGNMLEGQETEFTLKLSRASNSLDIPVTVTCDHPDGVIIPTDVAIPAGQTETTFLVKLKQNGTSNDSRRLKFTAKCTSEVAPYNGWGAGECLVMATDQTLPDAVITNMRVVTNNPAMGDSIIVETTIRNGGYSKLEAGADICFEFEDFPLQRRYLERDVLTGSVITQLDTIATPNAAGLHTLKATVDYSKNVDEIDELNNEYAVDVLLYPFFTAYNVHTNKLIYNNYETVTVTGKVRGTHPYNADIEVYLINGNTRYVVNSKTDRNGSFSVEWKPEGNLAGHFIVGACTPGEDLTTEMTVFEMYGMRRYDSGFILKEFEVGESVDGYVDILNHGSLKLTNIQASVSDMPATATVTLEKINTLRDDRYARLYFHLSGVKASTSEDWESFTMKIQSAEGAKLEQKVYFYVYSAKPVLKADVSDINTTMVKGKTREYPITLRNEGREETGRIEVDLGNFDWLRSATPAKMASLKQGEETTIVLLLTPTASMPLNSITTGSMAINCANGSSLLLPIYIETVSEETGMMAIDVVDEFTLNTDAAPHVEGATVSVLHPVTGKLLRQAVTGSDGLATFDLMPEGKYTVRVTHPRHSSWEQTVMVHPDRTIRQRAFISYSAITVDMHYEQTEVEDEYNIVTTVTYETNVPAPVVKLDMPEKTILDEIQTPYIIYAHLTNVGLITAFDATYHIEEEVNGYRFTPLIEGPWDILPQQTISIPIEITKTSNAEEENESRISGPMYLPKRGQAYSMKAPRRVPGVGIACGMGAMASFFNRCGAGADGSGSIEQAVVARMQVSRVCSGAGDWGSFGGGGSGSGSPGGKPNGQTSGSNSSSSSYTNGGTVAVACNPELAQQGPQIISGLVGTACPSIGFALSVVEGANTGNWSDFFQTVVTTAIPVVAQFKTPDLAPYISQAIDSYGMASTLGLTGGDGDDSRRAPDFDEDEKINTKRMTPTVVDYEPPKVYYSWKDEDGKQRMEGYGLMSKSISRGMANKWVWLSRGRERTNLTEDLDAPIYFSNRYFKNPQPEVGDVENPDWYPSAMHAWSDNTVAAQFAFYHSMRLMYELFGEWGCMYLTEKDLKAISDTLKVLEDHPEIPLDKDAKLKLLKAFPVDMKRFSMHEIVDKEQFKPDWYNEHYYWMKEGTYSENGNNYPPAAHMVDHLINTLRLERGEPLPEATRNNYIHADVVEGCLKILKQSLKFVNRAGYDNESQMQEAENKKLADYLQLPRSTTCSSVKLEIEQKMTMTRQAVRGTLTVKNGSEYQAMRDVKLNLRVTDPMGNVADSHIMEITTESLSGFTGALDYESGWELAAGQTGTAKILFIPTRYAAPDEPVQYTFAGTISFIDPFTGLELTRELEVERLTVNPSPVLDLTYFMQRDVMGDDALTTDVVEPIVPSQFSLLINNKGKGDATKVRMQTQQPKIVDNEKGLLVDFEIESSQLNGGDKTLAMGQTVGTDFGTIKAGTSTLAQWWLTSSLTGHFTDYDVQATHVTSYDNPDLTLLDQVTIHEMIHQIELPFVDGTTDGTTPPANIGFLVNDVEDYHDAPDQLYTMDGSKTAVGEVTSATWTRLTDSQYQLQILPKAAGWVYGNIADPTGGVQNVASVIRSSDLSEMPLVNFWQTDRTLVDKTDPIYENLIHFADEVSLAGETYIINFELKPVAPLEVSEFSGVPNDDAYTRDEVGEVIISFNRPINESTFTTADLKLMRAGETLDVSALTISKVNETTFRVNLSSLTTLDGYYQLTVQTADITDEDGINGTGGKSIGWTQVKDGKANLVMQIEPEDAGTVTPGSSRQNYFGTVALSATPKTGYKFSCWKEGDNRLSDQSDFNYTMTGPKTVKAVFTPKRYPVIIEYNANRGTVTGGGDGLFEYNTEVTLKAEPKSDCYFAGWQREGSNLIFSEEPELTFTVTGNNSFAALFLPTSAVNVMLSENNDDNTSFFDNPHGKFFMVSSDRHLKSWQWNPVCFPFDISEQEINKLWGYATMITRLTSVEGDIMKFEYQFDIKAGVPYLMKPERTVTTPRWEINGDNIVVAPEPLTDEFNGYQFVGSYSPHTWDTNRSDGNQEYYYGVGSGKIIKAKDKTDALKGLRAYFVLPAGANARISFGDDDETTGIKEVDITHDAAAPVCIYNLQGQYLGSHPESLQKGLYIINGRKQVLK